MSAVGLSLVRNRCSVCVASTVVVNHCSMEDYRGDRQEQRLVRNTFEITVDEGMGRLN